MDAHRSSCSTFAVITGGGTAGHVLPALAIAESLVDGGREPGAIHYVGAARGMETRLLPTTPFPHTFLEISGLQREVSAANLRRNAAMVPQLWTARRAAIELLRRLRPAVVVSVGGYASVPTVLAARRLQIPVVVVSFDRRPGLATRLAARTAAVSAVAYPDSPLPRVIVTGAPLRRQLLAVDRDRDRAAARVALGLPPDRFVVAVTGGSQGSAALNQAVADFVDARAGDTTLAVHQIAGDRFLDRSPSPRDGHDGVLHQIVGYEENVERLYAAADLLIGRGGASTVAEVAVTGTPSVLVPWSGAAEDHQTLNVRWLSDQGGAVLLPESDVARIGDLVDGLRADPAALAAVAANAARAGELHRGGRLANLIEDVAAGRAAARR